MNRNRDLTVEIYFQFDFELTDSGTNSLNHTYSLPRWIPKISETWTDPFFKKRKISVSQMAFASDYFLRQVPSWYNTIEFSLNGFTEVAEFRDKKYYILKTLFELATQPPLV